jgi:Xaa-Pro aminopeptidase
MEQIDDGLILVRGAGADGLNASFYYLTGLAESRGMLLLAPGGTRVDTGRMYPGPDYVRGRSAREILFLPPRDALAARWGEDAAATADLAPDAAGVDRVYASGQADALISQALATAARVHFIRGHAAQLGGAEDPDSAWVAGIRRRFFHLDLRDATPLVHEMRRLKDAEEIRGVERSVSVVAEALDRVLQLLRPGTPEHEIEGEITRIYRKHGGTHAFEPIVASGAHALSLHYTENHGTLAAGDLLLVDTGVSIDGYKADITRTYPVDGRFTGRQREVYDAVLHAQQVVFERCRPGALLGDLHAAAFEAIDSRGFGEHFIHGLGHHLGLETHDVGDVHRPLGAGAVITVEPGAYVTGEDIGVRIEDDVAITEDGHRVLSETIPSGAEAIEQRLAGR